MLYDLNFAASFKKGESDPYNTGNSLIENPILSVSDKTVVATKIEDCHVYLAEDQINNDPLTANTLTFASERDTKQDKSIGTHSSFNDGNVNHGHNHTDHMANSTDASQPTVSHRNLNSGTGTLGAQFKSTHSKAEEPVDTRKTITKLILKLYCDSGGNRLDSNEMMVTR
ncbi:hypothetical protein T03_8287 [Trichinella britovi]|uniref:Uncharacterized protein n=1 Tax=Trichinella britovi TaxID=45882 RepID=A0A0V1D586_TRIBR|nr:hypothetical protein T03_8287 [Trichinella britovi]